MLAETVLPSPVEVPDLVKNLGPRYALDYLELPHSLDEQPVLYRCLLRPGRPARFERFEPDPEVAAFFAGHRRRRDLFAGFSRDVEPEDPGAAGVRHPDWRAMAGVLPEALRAELLGAAGPAVPLVISGHSWLSLMPWPALALDDGTRLVERAIVTQAPVLSCLTAEGAPAVAGEALVRLVGADRPGASGVHVARERVAWGLAGEERDVPLSSCPVRSGSAPEPLAGTHRLTDVLTADRWAFLHIASHGGPGTVREAAGGYDGLRQELQLPEQRLSAARALSLRWPTSVLMASCHVGQVVNARDAEPLNFVMAVLTGGARCVVAGIAAIEDAGTGRVAHDMVAAIRAEGLPLDEALWRAQLAAYRDGVEEAGWALLAAYVR
jgi:hypothetical protein